MKLLRSRTFWTVTGFFQFAFIGLCGGSTMPQTPWMQWTGVAGVTAMCLYHLFRRLWNGPPGGLDNSGLFIGGDVPDAYEAQMAEEIEHLDEYHAAKVPTVEERVAADVAANRRYKGQRPGETLLEFHQAVEAARQMHRAFLDGKISHETLLAYIQENDPPNSVGERPPRVPALPTTKRRITLED